MLLRPTRSIRTYTLLPYTTLFRSDVGIGIGRLLGAIIDSLPDKTVVDRRTRGAIVRIHATTRRRDLHGAAVVGIERALAVDAVGRHRDHAGAVAGRVIGGIRTAVAGGDDDGRTACVRARDRIGFGLAAGTGTAEAQVDDLGDVGVVRTRVA